MMYLVTGCLGFIGSSLVRMLLDENADARVINLDKLTYAGNMENLQDIASDVRYIFVRGDICDKKMVLSLLEKYDPDIVINLAAESHVDRSINEPDVFATTNVMGTLNLLSCCKHAWYDSKNGKWRTDRKYVQVSTDEVYGSLGTTDCFTESTPLAPRSPYAASKASADMFVKAFYDTWNMPVNITRCCNNYGPYQFPEKLIPLVINNACGHNAIPVYGDGLNVREWLYVTDHCRAIDVVAQRGAPGRVYNVGSGVEASNIEIVKKIIEALRQLLGDDDINENLITYVKDRPGHDRRYRVDSSRLRGELGWEPCMSFDEGIISTVKWYVDNGAWLRHVVSGEYQTYYDSMYKGRSLQEEPK